MDTGTSMDGSPEPDLGFDAGLDAGFDGGPEDADPRAFVCDFDKGNGILVPMFENQVTADGCNECHCLTSDTDPSGYTTPCTQAGCFPNQHERCDTHADCSGARSFCHFDIGCAERGWCANVQSGCYNAMNPIAPPGTEAPVFCGCDGVTYEGRVCFGRPWQHLGPCQL